MANLKNLQELLKQKDSALKNFKMNKNNYNSYDNNTANIPNSCRNKTTNISYDNQGNQVNSFITHSGSTQNSQNKNNLLIKSASNYLDINKNIFSSHKKNPSNHTSYKKDKFSSQNFTNEKDKNFHSYSKDKNNYDSNNNQEKLTDYGNLSNYKLTPIEDEINFSEDKEEDKEFTKGKISSPKF